MKKRISTRRLIGIRSYSTTELAECLGVHPQTIRTWRAGGLRPIDPDSHFSLYLGDEVRRYCRSRQAARRVPLGTDEFFCFSCHTAVKGLDVKVVDCHKRIGTGMEEIQYQGKCAVCGHDVRKYFTKPVHILAEGEGTNVDHQPSLYHSLGSGKE